MISQDQPLVPQHEKLLGRTLRDGEYTVRRLLGQGGTGTVFLAVHTSLGTPFALKQIRADATLPEAVVIELDHHLQGGTGGSEHHAPPLDHGWCIPTSGGELTDHFIREALFLARLCHPAIPALYDYFFQDGYWYLVMDYIVGPTLHTYLRQSAPLPALEGLGYAIQLCEILDYLHRQTPPVYFRDLKPSNILLTPESTLALIDFGAAAYSKESTEEHRLPLGSLGYIAPEQCRSDGPPDARADLYSLGVMLYEMFSGQRPVRSKGFDSLHIVNPAISHLLSGLIKLATRPEPRQRFQSAYTFYLALERAYGIEERRTYQQSVIAATDPQSDELRPTEIVEAQMEEREISTQEAFDPGTSSAIKAELERRRALCEALRKSRQQRVAQHELEIELASVDESLKRRALPKSPLREIVPPPPATPLSEFQRVSVVYPVHKRRGPLQIGIFLLLICFVLVTSLLVYLRSERSMPPLPTQEVATTTIAEAPTTSVPTSSAEAFSRRTLPALPRSAADNASVYVESEGHGFIYMNGGYAGHQAAPDQRYDHHLYRYDITAARWEVAVDDFPALVNNAAAVDERGQVFLTAGYSPDARQVVSALYHFTPQTKTVQKIVPPAAIPLGFGGALLADRQGHLYLTQGFLQAGDPHAQAGTGWYRYDIASRKWETLAPLPRGFGYAALIPDSENHILLFGGSQTADQRVPSAAIYRYDITRNTWTQLSARMPHALSGMAACQIWPGQLAFVGGYDPVHLVGMKSVWRYDVRSAHWQRLPDLTGGSLLGSAACDGLGQLYLTRGADDPKKPTRDFWRLEFPVLEVNK